jgi:hypothetical protein
MKSTLLNRNIVLIKRGIVPEKIKFGQVTDPLRTIFPGSKPLLNSLPGINIFNIPDKQFTVTMQYENITISDDLQGGAGNLDELIQVASKLNTSFEELLVAYGFNHRYVVEKIDGSKLESFLNTKELRDKNVVKSSSVKAASFSFVEKTDDRLRQVVVNNIFDKSGSYSGNVQFLFNAHKEKDNIELPGFDEIKRMIEVLEESNLENIKNMLDEA